MSKSSRTRPLTDAEEEEIQRQIAADPEDADATDAALAQARPFSTAFPELAASIKRARGRPRIEAPRRQVSLRLSKDVIDKFKATGKGWQGRINDVLEKAKL